MRKFIFLNLPLQEAVQIKVGIIEDSRYPRTDDIYVWTSGLFLSSFHILQKRDNFVIF
jgi:hypothetical protein